MKKIIALFRHVPFFPVIILFLVTFCGIAGSHLAPHDPTDADLLRSLMPPFQDREFPLGTDQLGRDILSRIICGARISLIVGITVVVFAGSIGAILAMLSALFLLPAFRHSLHQFRQHEPATGFLFLPQIPAPAFP